VNRAETQLCIMCPLMGV